MTRFIRLTIFILIAILGINNYVVPSLRTMGTAYAVGDLLIDWGVPEGDPIFTESNFAPGNSETRTVNVENTAPMERMVGVKGISNGGNLGPALEIIIRKNGTDVYGGSSSTGPKTLKKFFDESDNPLGIPLAPQSAGENANFEFEVIFKPDSGNNFQNKSISFDIQLGVTLDLPESCRRPYNGEIITGTAENNRLHGTSRDDLIIGLEGDDRIDGGGGNDCIIGNEGHDRLDGGSGDDFLQGGEGADRISGGSGKDSLFGGNDNDQLNGGSGNDLLDGEAGNDRLRGGSGSDECHNGENIGSCEL